MKIENNRISLTIKEAKRIQECLSTLSADGGHLPYDEEVEEYNK